MPVPQHSVVIVYSEEVDVNIQTILTSALDMYTNYVGCHQFTEVLISG
jgi:hypothetical protein